MTVWTDPASCPACLNGYPCGRLRGHAGEHRNAHLTWPGIIPEDPPTAPPALKTIIDPEVVTLTPDEYKKLVADAEKWAEDAHAFREENAQLKVEIERLRKQLRYVL